MLPSMEAEPERAILSLVGEVMGVLELDEFRVALVHALQRVVPSDWVSINGIAPNPRDHWAVMEPPVPTYLWERFRLFAHQNPLVERLQRTQDGRAYRFTDVTTPQALEATELWKQVYAPLGVGAQVAFTLPAEPGWLLGVALSRRPEHGDYTDAERGLLNHARPFLIQAYRNVLGFEALRETAAGGRAGAASLGLTDREGQVLELIAAGQSNQAAADALDLSVRTVQKHLERVYRKLGVSSRTEAVARLSRRG